MDDPHTRVNQKNLAPLLAIALFFVFLQGIVGVGGVLLMLVGIVLLVKSGKMQGIIRTLFPNSTHMADQVSGTVFMQRGGSMWRGFKMSILGLIGLWILFRFVVIIDAGETGVYSLFGKVRDNELRSGIHLVIPLSHIERMSIRTEQYTMSIAPDEGQVAGDDSISSLTKEGLEVSIDFTALYRLDEAKASDIYREVGLDYVSKLIRPEIRGVIRDVVSQYEAKELYSEKRQEASVRMATLLREKLEGRGIVIEEAVIRNVQLPASLAQAIQEKLASEQEAQRYDFVLDKEKKEAERKRIEAEGQRDAQRIINESLNADYLNYLYIKELKDRQGTIYVPVSASNGMPLFKGL